MMYKTTAVKMGGIVGMVVVAYMGTMFMSGVLGSFAATADGALVAGAVFFAPFTYMGLKKVSEYGSESVRETRQSQSSVVADD